VIANASEGELGTFKDRHILERDPHGVIDAALVAIAVVGARRLIIYLRDDYDHLYRELQQVINEMRVAGLGADVEFDLRRSGGAYICGEETALIASLEGQRGRPREQPPFPTTHGLFGRPTLVQNIETLYRLRAAWGMRVE
ncbi:NADH-quinone oxidoreductase subunit F, partial [Escherichia coli]|nr:NADH-quinone oxidoreductase subunit F [Escherichia coli]